MDDTLMDQPRAQIKLGEGNPEEWGLLSLNLLRVHLNRKPSDAMPWHVDGGDWTFFDCRTAPPQLATFTVGIRAESKGAGPIGWGEAIIQVTDRSEGVKLLECMSRAFKQKSPSERKQQPLEPWKFKTAVLGEGMKRESQGGFSGQGGSWSATKWFLERDGFSAEVFFNYNLKEMKAEFSEKDPEYREDLLAVLAIAVRDGPRPQRSPQTDTNLTDVGPSFGRGHLLAKNGRFFQFDPAGKQVLFASKSLDGSTILFAIKPDQPDRTGEVARIRQELGSVAVLDSELNQILIVEILSKEKGVISSDDTKRLWWIDRKKKDSREVTGPWESKSFNLAEKPVSPDGRFVAITSWRPRTDGNRGNYSVIHVHDLRVGTTQTIELVNQSPEPIGWVGSDKDLRLVFLENHRWDKGKKPKWNLAEPETGKYAAAEKAPLPSDESSSRLSPDGALVAAVEGKEKLTITDVKTGQKRSFLFHEDDRRFVQEEGFQWLSPRYLLLHLDRLAFLDVHTMKMSYPLAKKDQSSSHTFSPDFKWLLWQKPDEGLYISPVVLPSATP